MRSGPSIRTTPRRDEAFGEVACRSISATSTRRGDTARPHARRRECRAGDQADLEAKWHRVAKIDCHGEVWVAIKGATVTCDLVDEAGKEYLWSATFTDDKGAHEHSVKPK